MTERTERVEFTGTQESWMTMVEWDAVVGDLAARLSDAGLAPADVTDDLREAFGGITFRDTESRLWRHDGSGWWRWDDGVWASDTPPDRLLLDRVEFETPVEMPDESGSDGPMSGLVWATAASDEPPRASTYRPSHLVPSAGLPAWSTPDPSTESISRLDGWLDVELVEQREDGWAEVRCSNDWTTCVDGRLLIPVEPP